MATNKKPAGKGKKPAKKKVKLDDLPARKKKAADVASDEAANVKAGGYGYSYYSPWTWW